MMTDDARSAQAALDAADAAERSIRDTPWPVWLYPINGALMGLLVLSTLVDTMRPAALLWVSLLTSFFNLLVGRWMGTPYTLPTNRVFLVSCGIACGCAIAAVIATATMESPTTLVIMLAVAAMASYGLGSVSHYRSTRS
ncbi:hypothetical protein ACMYYO_04445 [Dermacoccaceae bacterium W4C1]